MRTHVLDDEVLAKATEAAEFERKRKLNKVSSKRRAHRQAMKALERKRELDELRENLSDFEDYWADEG